MLTFPVNGGKTLNIVAFHTTPDRWTDHTRLTRDGTREEALRDFAGYGPNVTKLLKLCDPKLSIVRTPTPANPLDFDHRKQEPLTAK
jgi:salicylate hydroxylase